MPTIHESMTLSRKIIYILSCVFVALLIAAVFLPKSVSTSVSKNIEAPKTYVFNLLNNQKSATTWNSWLDEDKNIELSFDKISVGTGSGYSWKSKIIGDGSIKYSSVTTNEKIEADLIMEGDKSQYVQTMTEKEGVTTLNWKFSTYMPFPKNITGPILKYIVNKHNETSISKISMEISKRQKGQYYGYQLKEATQNKRHFVTSRGQVSFDQINAFYAQNLSAIYQKLQQLNIASIGAPCTLYYNYDESKQMTDMAVAVPVLEIVTIKDLGSESLAEGNAVIVDYFGDSSKAENAHYALDEYIKDRGYLQNIPVIEEFVTDPLKEKDQSKWLTKIYYYISEKK